MSGICGVWHQDDAAWVSETVASLSRGLALHTTEFRQQRPDGTAGIGLSARFATQQIYEDASILIVCDAELYNEAELQALAGDRRPEPDSGRIASLLAVLYGRLGPAFVNKLVGAFSFVLWDRRARKMVAATDGFGIKRLALHRSSRAVLISSRVDAIARSHAADLAINPRAIANILNFTADLAPDTIFQNVERLAPGTLVTVSASGIVAEKYWDMRYDLGDSEADEDLLTRELEATFQSSVAAHCKGQPFERLGAFLSGGTDSSTVVGMMSRMRQGAPKAFSIGFQEQSFNELGYAAIAAKEFSAEHQTYLVGPDDCFDALPDIVRYFDEPFGNSSAIPTYFCARLAASAGVTTLLAGDGGDELFGGNERYCTDKLFEMYHSIPAVLRNRLIEPVLAHVPMRNGVVGRARRYVDKANMPGVRRMLAFQFLSTHRPEEVFTSDFGAALGEYSIYDTPSRHYAEAIASHHLDRLLYVDMKITLADNDLPKVTCMSELAGVQVRFPFLHRPVAEFSGRVPASLKVKGFKKRYLFKKAFCNLLPEEILRKTKHGFGIPVSTWMKSDRRLRELSRDTLLSARAFERGYFRRDFIEDLFRRSEADDSTYYGDTIWTFLTLELWHRQVVDSAARAAV